VKWFYNGNVIHEDVILNNEDMRTLEIVQVSKYHRGFYECLGNYNIGPHYPRFSAKTFLDVIDELLNKTGKHNWWKMTSMNVIQGHF